MSMENKTKSIVNDLDKHLPSDINNIKVSLKQITKYILNKYVKKDKVNNFKDLNGVSKVAWEFISSLYDLR